ncbi:MAG: DEAD/DEAH box helicase [Syntrophomonas sp.]
MTIQKFRDLGLKLELLHMIEKKGFEEPTPIQSRAIPPGLTGRDIMGQAKTGTGKTAAFGLPILNQIIPGDGLQALVVCPTRELAVQVSQEILFLGHELKVYTLPVYGGQSIEIQIRGLKRRPEIIVGTPGRLIDHMNRGTIRLSGLKYVVLDEADEMLDMGFLPDIKKILEQCPSKRQTFLFSATLEKEIRDLAYEFMQEPEEIMIESPELTVPLTKQYYYEVQPRHKIETICQVIDIAQPPVSLIFCRTKKGADQLARVLNKRGYAADALHGDMSQRERDNVMERFRKGNIEILTATDLAARGLDVDVVTHVINFDIPEDPDSYVHRIGRTGRAGRTGTAITLVEPGQIRTLRVIEKHIRTRINRQSLPASREAVEHRQESLIKRVVQVSQQDLDIYRNIAAELIARPDAEQLLAAALKLLDNEIIEYQGTPEPSRVPEIDSATVHVELPIGKMQGMHPRRLMEFLSANTSIKPKQVGDIDIQGSSTYVEVPIEFVDEIYQAFDRYENARKSQRKRLPSFDHAANKKAN